MGAQPRIRSARRFAGLSQAELAQRAGVHRSAVSHWERQGGRSPNLDHLRTVAQITGVQFEWLATGRGAMQLTKETALDSIPAADALLIDDSLEMRLVCAFRQAPAKSHIALVEVVEQLARMRVGRS